MKKHGNRLLGIFSEAKASELEASYSKTGKLQVKKLGFGKKSYPLFTFEKITGKKRVESKSHERNKRRFRSRA